MIRKALRCLHNFDIRGLWIDALIAKALDKTLIENDDLSTTRPKTNIKPWFVDGFGILVTIFDVDEDLEFLYRQHKFDDAGFRTVDSKDLLKPIETWKFYGHIPALYEEFECSYEQNFGERRNYTSAKRNRVLDILTKAGLLERKPNLTPTKWIIRLRGDKIIDALKEISPTGYDYLKY